MQTINAFRNLKDSLAINTTICFYFSVFPGGILIHPIPWSQPFYGSYHSEQKAAKMHCCRKSFGVVCAISIDGFKPSTTVTVHKPERGSQTDVAVQSKGRAVVYLLSANRQSSIYGLQSPRFSVADFRFINIRAFVPTTRIGFSIIQATVTVVFAWISATLAAGVNLPQLSLPQAHCMHSFTIIETAYKSCRYIESKIICVKIFANGVIRSVLLVELRCIIFQLAL